MQLCSQKHGLSASSLNPAFAPTGKIPYLSGPPYPYHAMGIKRAPTLQSSGKTLEQQLACIRAMSPPLNTQPLPVQDLTKNPQETAISTKSSGCVHGICHLLPSTGVYQPPNHDLCVRCFPPILQMRRHGWLSGATWVSFQSSLIHQSSSLPVTHMIHIALSIDPDALIILGRVHFTWGN